LSPTQNGHKFLKIGERTSPRGVIMVNETQGLFDKNLKTDVPLAERIRPRCGFILAWKDA